MMYSNVYSLHPIWQTYLTPKEGEDHPPTEGRFSVTDLIGPPRIRTLKMKYWDVLQEDISDRVWRVDGITMDEKLSQIAESLNHEGEGRFLIKHKMEKRFSIGNKRPVVVGVPDIIDISRRKVIDWKRTLQSKLIRGDLEDWWKQLDIYSLLYNTQDSSVRDGFGCYAIEGEILSIFIRDFKSTLGGKSCPIQEIGRLTPRMSGIEGYIKDRLKDHMENPERECLAEEKWTTGDLFAIIKRGNKRALKVCDSEKEAIRYLNSKKIKDEKASSQYSLEVRPGVSKRCEKYCPVRATCEYSPFFNKNIILSLPKKECLWKEIIPEVVLNTEAINTSYTNATDQVARPGDLHHWTLQSTDAEESRRRAYPNPQSTPIWEEPLIREQGPEH